MKSYTEKRKLMLVYITKKYNRVSPIHSEFKVKKKGDETMKRLEFYLFFRSDILQIVE